MENVRKYGRVHHLGSIDASYSGSTGECVVGTILLGIREARVSKHRSVERSTPGGKWQSRWNWTRQDHWSSRYSA